MLQLAGISIDGVSIGGLETCIQLPGHDLAFDMGRCRRSAVARSRVLFTHAHIDHMGDVASHCATRSLVGMKPPTYVVPRENLDAFHELFAAWRRLDHSDLEHTVIPASPGTEVQLGKGLMARAFRSVHRVPTLGWGLWRTKQKLLPEYQGRSNDEIRNARLSGRVITESVTEAELAFTGDSMIEAIEREEVLRTARVLVMEVTFLDDKVSVEATRDKGHIHLDEVIERAELFQNEAILFTHLSARHGQAEALDILDRKLPPILRDRVTLLPRPEDG